MAALTVAEVRPLAEDEIEAVERAVRRVPSLHRERLARQTNGDVLYLFAWVRGEPVGHVMLIWSSLLGAGTAHLEDLAVDAPWRRRGIGTQLMQRCEEEALARGCDRIALDVGVENDRARAFYRRLGYSELEGQLPHVVRWRTLEETGDVGEGSELCTTFTKALGLTAA